MAAVCGGIDSKGWVWLLCMVGFSSLHPGTAQNSMAFDLISYPWQQRPSISGNPILGKDLTLIEMGIERLGLGWVLAPPFLDEVHLL